MEFTLVYDGPLPAAGAQGKRVKEKHEIRKQLHPQLRRLWELKLPHWLIGTQTSRLTCKFTAGQPIVNQIATGFPRCKHSPHCRHKFVSLVRSDLMLACRLEVLFLRRGSPHGGIISDGDIDNRLKVLFDGLRSPHDCDELPSDAEAIEGGMYCLLQDDSLISDVRITADTLLTPQAQDEGKAYVQLIIGVRLRPLEFREGNADFA